MATIVRTPSATWKALIRKQGWPVTAKTFRTKRDAEDWARRTEDEMVRGVYIERGASERLTLGVALDRYLSEVTPTKKPATQQTEIERAKPLRAFFSKYSLAAITPDLVARYRDMRLATALKPLKKSKSIRLLSASTVRLELALLGHLFTTAIREWRLGLAQNPVALVRKPKPAEGRDRRLDGAEEQALMRAVDAHSKLTLVGVYASDLLVPAFPCVLPKLCLVLNILTSASQPFQRLKIRVLKDEETLAEGELPMQDWAALAAGAVPDDGESDEKEKRLALTAHFVFSPLKFDAPALIRVRVETEDGEMKASGLRVAQMPAISIAQLGDLAAAPGSQQ